MKRTFRIDLTSSGTWAVRIVMEIPRRHEVKIETIGECDTKQQAEALAAVMRDCRNPALPPKPTWREEMKNHAECEQCGKAGAYAEGGYPNGFFDDLQLTQMEGGSVFCKGCADKANGLVRR